MSAPGRRDQLWLVACPPGTAMEFTDTSPARNLWADYTAHLAAQVISAEGGWSPGPVSPADLAQTIAWPYREWPRHLAGLNWRHTWWRQDSPVEGDHR